MKILNKIQNNMKEVILQLKMNGLKTTQLVILKVSGKSWGGPFLKDFSYSL